MKNATAHCGVLSLILALFILMGTGQAMAGPGKISFQGKATDSTGNPLPDGDYTLRLSLFPLPTPVGNELWDEVATVHVTGGLFTHLLGSINSIGSGLFTGYDSLFLDVWVGPHHLSPLIPLTSAGYAMSVNSIDNASGGSIYGDVYVRNGTSSELCAKITAGEEGGGEFRLHRANGTVGIYLNGDYPGTAAVQFPAGAIQATEMLDEPGVGSDNNTGITLTGPAQYLAGRTMTAPVDGYVLVIATASVNIQHSNGTRTSCAFGVSDNITQFVESAVGYVVLPSSLPTGTYEFPAASHALFPIAKGDHAFYVLGSSLSTVTVYDVQLTECFFPTAYTTVSSPVPPTGASSGSQTTVDPEAERQEAQAFHNARVQAELDRMSVELEAVRRDMDELKSNGEPRR